MAPNDKRRNSRQKQLDSFKPVSLTLSDRGKEILEWLGSGNPPSKVADAVGISRPSMSYWIKKLKKLGFIRLQKIDVFHYYEFTYRGSKVLTRSESDVVVVLEDYPVKFDVVSWGRADCLAWRKLGAPQNWVKLGFKLGNIRVVRTSRSIIVHPGRLKGDDSWHLIFVVTQECNRVARWLEQNADIVLRPGEPIKKPSFQVYDELSEQITRSFTFKNQDGEGADRSPPAKKGHWELGPKAANEFMRSASRLKQLTQQLREIDQRLENIESGMLPALDAWTKVGNRLLELLARINPKEPPSQPLKDGRYII